jgi:hypothetical protein
MMSAGTVVSAVIGRMSAAIRAKEADVEVDHVNVRQDAADQGKLKLAINQFIATEKDQHTVVVEEGAEVMREAMEGQKSFRKEDALDADTEVTSDAIALRRVEEEEDHHTEETTDVTETETITDAMPTLAVVLQDHSTVEKTLSAQRLLVEMTHTLREEKSPAHL